MFLRKRHPYRDKAKTRKVIFVAKLKLAGRVAYSCVMFGMKSSNPPCICQEVNHAKKFQMTSYPEAKTKNRSRSLAPRVLSFLK